MSKVDPWPAVTLLRPRRLGELWPLLAARCGAELVDADLRRIHHRPGQSFTRVDRVTVSRGGSLERTLLVTHVSARRLPTDSGVLAVGGQDVAVWLYPDDPYLPALVRAADPSGARRLLDRHGLPAGAVRLRRRAYRPTRRAVVEVAVEDGAGSRPVLYLKVLRPRRAARIARVHDQLASTLPVPGVLERDPSGSLALEALPGRPLRRALVDGSPVPDAAALLRLSEGLAQAPLVRGGEPRRFADPAAHVGAMCAEVPELRPLVDRVLAELWDASAGRPDDVVVHGDLHGGQVLLDDRGVIRGLLDLDGVGRGDMAHDAGNLVVHVAALGDAQPAARSRTAGYGEELAVAYSAVVGAEHLSRARAGAWLALAAAAHRRRDADTCRARVARAARALV